MSRPCDVARKWREILETDAHIASKWAEIKHLAPHRLASAQTQTTTPGFAQAQEHSEITRAATQMWPPTSTSRCM